MRGSSSTTRIVVIDFLLPALISIQLRQPGVNISSSCRQLHLLESDRSTCSDTVAMGAAKLPRHSDHDNLRRRVAMSSSRIPAAESYQASIAAGLSKLAVLPNWLLAPLQADRVSDALRRAVPEFSSGALTLRSAKIKRMTLKDDAGGRWAGTYNLSVEGPDGKRSIALRGTFTPPALRRDDAAESQPLERPP